MCVQQHWPPANSQRGSVSIVALLLLALIVMSMLVKTILVSDVGINDTLNLDDSIKAMFLAESTVERASWNYANSVACASLPEASAIALGSGTGQVTAAVLGTNCQITVVGNVNSAVRTLQVELNLSSAVSAWAVGKDGVILQRVGTTWSAVASGTTEDFKGVFCANSSNCFAVGKKGIVSSWSGGAWSTSVIDSDEDYEDVACAPNNPNYCVLVGKDDDGVARFWNGAWSGVMLLAEDLKSVACPTTTCYAVGKDGFGSRYQSSAWNTENLSTSEDMNGVDCLSASNCWAVGKKQGNNFTFAERSGSTTWTEITVSSTAKQDLNDVSCSAASNCWAVGKNGRALRNTGSGWSYYGAISSRELEGVDCVASDNTCLAVGKNGVAYYWDGSAWAAETTGTTETLESVHYVGGSGGAGGASIVSWREIIN